MDIINSYTLFGSIIGFWAAIISLIVALFMSEKEEQGFGALFSGLIFIGLVYFWGNVNIMDYLDFNLIGIYLIIGLLYSFIRTFIFARKLGISGKRELKEHIFRWWFLWPVSLIFWILSDVIQDLYDFIYKRISKFYEYIFELGLKDK